MDASGLPDDPDAVGRAMSLASGYTTPMGDVAMPPASLGAYDRAVSYLPPQGALPPQSAPAVDKSYRGSVLPFSRDASGSLHFDPTAGILGQMWDAATLPGDVYHGKVDPNSDEGFARAQGLAGIMAGGGAPLGNAVAADAAKEGATALGMFAGPKSATADLGALAKAQDLAASGASRDDIWKGTGWFQGADQKWRYEIPDHQSAMIDPFKHDLDLVDRHIAADLSVARREGTVPQALSLSDVLSHGALESAYFPTAESGPSVLFDNFAGGKLGSYSPEHDIVTLDNGSILHDQGGRSTMLHELQHAIQSREGFARGASMSEYARGPMFDQKARNLSGDLSKALTGGFSAKPGEISGLIKYGDPGELNSIAAKHGFGSLDDAMRFLSSQDEKRTPYSQYRRTAGEVEARNVQTRMNMTPEQRAAAPPWQTQDVPDNQQILRMDPVSAALAISRGQ